MAISNSYSSFSKISTSCFLLIYYVSILLPSANSVSFNITSFNPDLMDIQYDGDATPEAGSIQFNRVDYLYRVGQAVYSNSIPIWDSDTGKVANFTTHFTFRIDTGDSVPTRYGHGLSFFLAPFCFQIPPNSGGGFLGLFNTRTSNSSRNGIVSVEFDSNPDTEWDPNYEHVGININSIASKVTAPWNASLHRSEIGNAWIVYNSSAMNLSVYWSYGSNPNSSISYLVDLKEILPRRVMVGFSAATGIYVEKHFVYSWELSSDLDFNLDSSIEKWDTDLIIIVSLGVTVGIAAAVLETLLIIMAIKNYRKRSNGNKEVTNLASSM
ncbi:OLC1v1008306C1 [Oldenlandia corymbosa var. corymbosa]|uniref:OLC1v1008306C1 n=1 Tax=Oldenlandia corymbosa var. corymbosa TaxID=529605 RepID=A0AAV1DPH2_OLDCO|nr:OLC1v1008306C1 [Oldenlandia corymbosa var. corymbosa]